MLRSAELLKEGNVGMKKKQTNKRINWIKGLTGGGMSNNIGKSGPTK